MAGHQAVGPDLELIAPRVVSQELEIALPARIIEEHRGSAIAAVGDVMCLAW